MQVPAQLGQFGKGLNQAIPRIPGMGGHKADPLYSGQGAQAVKQADKVRPPRQVLAVAVDVLPQKGNFFIALGGQAFYFGADGLRRAALFSAPDIGNDTVCAKVVAAPVDVDEGLVPPRAPGRQV